MKKALILAAGPGTRLKPYTDNCPKPMVKILDKPVLEHTIELLKKYDVTDIAINLYHFPEIVEDYFYNGEKFGVRITYSREETLLGTAGALKKLQGFFDDTFVVIYGDVLSLTNIASMLEFHQNHNGIATIGLYRVDNPTECGIVEIKEDNEITRFVEKPKDEEVFSNLANAGVYILDPKIIEYIPAGVYYDFGKDLLPDLLQKNEVKIFGYTINEYLIDIGSIEKFKKANQEFNNFLIN